MRYFVTIIFLWLSCLSAAYAEKIAIIGGGASGLVTAWLLEQKNNVTLFEAEDHLGGHVDTQHLIIQGKPVIVEGGAEFMTVAGYPHFINLLNYLHIPLVDYTPVAVFTRTDQVDTYIMPPLHDGQIEWISFSEKNLQRSLALSIVEINAKKLIADHNVDITLQEFLNSLPLDEDFKNNFMYPFLAANWGVTVDEIKNFSAYNSLLYLVQQTESPKLRCLRVLGGLDTYINALQKTLQHTLIKLNTPILSIEKRGAGYILVTKNGNAGPFDQVIIATNPNIAANLLKQIPEEKPLVDTLSKVDFYKTTIAIHGDSSFMPKDPTQWRVVNVRYDGQYSETTIYHENNATPPVFKTWLNYSVNMPTSLYKLLYYQHPIIDSKFYRAQKAASEAQGQHHIWFAGNWMGESDSHESAINSAINLGNHFVPNSQRMKLLLISS